MHRGHTYTRNVHVRAAWKDERREDGRPIGGRNREKFAGAWNHPSSKFSRPRGHAGRCFRRFPCLLLLHERSRSERVASQDSSDSWQTAHDRSCIRGKERRKNSRRVHGWWCHRRSTSHVSRVCPSFVSSVSGYDFVLKTDSIRIVDFVANYEFFWEIT